MRNSSTKGISGGVEGSDSTEVRKALRSSYLGEEVSVVVWQVLREGGLQVSQLAHVG